MGRQLVHAPIRTTLDSASRLLSAAAMKSAVGGSTARHASTDSSRSVRTCTPDVMRQHCEHTAHGNMQQ